MIYAAQKGHTEIVKLLLDADADPNIQAIDGSTALILAVELRHKEIVRLLLEAGADSNIKDKDGRTVLSRLQYYSYQNPPNDIVQLIKNR